MPKIYRFRPSHVLHESEQAFAAAAAQLPEDWIVVWSYSYQDESGQNREGDFLVFVPDLGIAVIEIKSGALHVDTRSGAWNTPHGDDPFGQLARETNGVLRRLKSQQAQAPWVAQFLCLPNQDLPIFEHYKHHPRCLFLGRNDLPALKELIVASLDIGLRLGDMSTLDWKDVDLKRQMIRKLTSKTGVVVTIPILPPLRRYLEVLPERSGSVFPELHAKYTGGHRISHAFKRLLKQLGIESQRDMGDGKRARSTHDIHSLRHTFVWLAADAGVPLPVVQSVVGHLSQEMTQHYATEAAKLLHLGRLPDLFGDKKAAQSPDELLALVRGRLADATKGNSWAVIEELRTLL